MFTEVTKMTLSTDAGCADFMLTIGKDVLRLEIEDRYETDRNVSVLLDSVDLSQLRAFFARAAEITNADAS